MNALFFLLCFLLGAAAVFVAGKIQLKNREKNLHSKMGNLQKGIPPNLIDQNLTEPLPQVPEQLNTITQKASTEIATDPSTENSTNPSKLLHKNIDDLYIVNELGQNVTSSLNLQETFHHLYTTINSMMDAAVLELSVWNERTAQWKLFTNLIAATLDSSPEYHNHFAEWCFKNNREVFLTDAEQDYERYVFKPLSMPDGRIAKSLLAYPIVYDERVSGTLCIVSFRKNSYSEYHQKIIRMLLGYIAVAMQNAITHEELQVTKQRAESSEKFMQQFLANMSHEIRTPINAVSGMTRLLLEKDPRSEQLKYLKSIRSASDSLLVIINDILDLSKIEAGKIELEQIDFSVFDLVNNVKEIMQFKAEEKGLLLTAMVDEKIAPVLIGDPTRLTQVLINLVGNAVKFTEKGTVSIHVDVKHSTDNNSETLSFTVRDTGIGMSAEQQKKLFQTYAQASTDTARKYGGTGLGLSISKQLVQLFGGNIKVSSVQGEGSVFSFSINYPISKSESPARKEFKVSNDMLQALTRIKVLLADDNEYNRIVARETLELKIKDVLVDEAFDGQMAVEMLMQKDYDLVLMDLVMPRLNGLEATQKIRNELPSPKNKQRILALTASVVKSEIDKCFAAGMNGFVPKPFNSDDLLGAIYKVMFGEQVSVFEDIVVTPKKSNSLQKLVDLNYLKEFTEGDPDRLQKYVGLFLSKTPQSISNLQAAMKTGDYERIRIAAHSMKPQLRFTGIMQGFELAETIEQYCTENIQLEQIPGLIDKLCSVCQQAIEELKVI